jgi:N6-adenosine-specific RNA methylase IME4
MIIEIDPELKALIPPLSPEEFHQLETNLIADGCRDPLVVWWNEDKLTLVDGHNRYAICRKRGIEFATVELHFENIERVRIWMRKNQMGRRNLNDTWRIKLQLGNKADLADIGRQRMVQGGGDRKSEGARSGLSVADRPDQLEHSSRLQIAVAAGTSTGQVSRYEQIAKKSPALLQEALDGKITLNAAYLEVKNEEKKIARAELVAEQKRAIEAGEITLPIGVYEVVAMDPPWAYGREYDPETSRVAAPYPEMTQAQLLDLTPPFAQDCALFLWTTHAFIFDAKELLDKWGFQYKATIVWDKERLGMGQWLRMQCEFCLIGIKGARNWTNTTWADVIREPRREHSRKPEKFYEMVESITTGRRLEFFSREQRKGWATYGNDTEKF